MQKFMILPVLMTVLSASTAIADHIEIVPLHIKEKLLRERIEKLEERKKVIVTTNQRGEGQVLKFVAYFCDWSKPLFLLNKEIGAGATCVFRINESIDDFFKKHEGTEYL